MVVSAFAAALALSNSGAAITTRAQQIAEHYWGAVPCAGQVEIGYEKMAPAYNAFSVYTLPGPTTCKVTFNAGPVWGTHPWQKFCTVMVHEYGHLTGHAHSQDSTDVMYTYYLSPIKECL